MAAWIIVVLSLAIPVCVVLSAIASFIGVRGALRAVNRTISEQSDDIASIDTRVSRMQRQRAADASVEARQVSKSLNEEAVDRLTAEQHSVTPVRPSIVRS